MGQYKPADHPVDESVAPLVQFFELVHIGDTILQMVQVYFDKEMKSYVDKNDFLSTIVREKKKFENNLDESVASGLNAGVNILMSQAEYILHSKQEPYDFCPELSKDGNNSQNNSKALVIDIEGPTKAAEAVVDCLRSHCQMLKGSTDKAILEVFHQEVGLRLHG
jgi:recyclin-1